MHDLSLRSGSWKREMSGTGTTRLAGCATVSMKINVRREPISELTTTGTVARQGARAQITELREECVVCLAERCQSAGGNCQLAFAILPARRAGQIWQTCKRLMVVFGMRRQ